MKEESIQKTFSNNLKSLLEEHNKTQLDLAKYLDVSNTTVNNYVKGYNTPRMDRIDQISKFFGVTRSELISDSNKLINTGTDTEGYITIKVYGEVPAGIPIEAIENIEDSEDLSLKDYSPSKQYIGLKVTGDSMYPDYLEGDNVIIEVTSEFYSGQDCVVYVNGYNATLKKVIKNDDETITLKPINPAYPPKTYGENDDPIKILGVVREIRRKK